MDAQQVLWSDRRGSRIDPEVRLSGERGSATAVVDTGPGGVRLELLGGFRLHVEGREVGLPRATQRALAAVALLGPVSRSRLAGTLWPDSPQSQALTNLRHVLWKVSGVLPAPCVVEAVGTDLRLASVVEVDIHRLVGQAHALLDTGSLPRDEGLAALLRPESCELLPDWDEVWLGDERERLRHLRLHTLEAWAEELAARGRFGLALDVALVALRTDVLRESAHRTVITVHRLEGNVREARRAFEVCRSVLAREIGVAPSPQTAALVP